MREENPCFGCNKRNQYCHALCGKYKTWDAKRKKEKAKRDFERYIQNIGYDSAAKRLKKGCKLF